MISLRRRLLEGQPSLVSHVYDDAVVPFSRDRQATPVCELVVDGLTYDLMLVDMRFSSRFPDHSAALSDEIVNGATLLLEPGPHLASIRQSLLVARGQWRAGAWLCGLLHPVAAVTWAPARAHMPGADFAALARGWIDAGTFPANGLVAFQPALGGGLQSSGLAYFTGQEMRLEPELAREGDRAVRLALRLAETLIHRGALHEAEQFSDPGGGTIRIEPSANRKFVRVWPG